MMSSCILLNETEKEIRNRFDIYRRALTHSLSRKDRREICQEKKGNDVGVNVHVALLQSCLNTLGMYSGSIDGLKGRQTAAALRRFEHLFGIPLGNLDLQSSIEYIVMFIALNRVQARG